MIRGLRSISTSLLRRNHHRFPLWIGFIIALALVVGTVPAAGSAAAAEDSSSQASTTSVSSGSVKDDDGGGESWLRTS